VENLNEVKISLNLSKNRNYQVIGFGENAVDQVCKVPGFPEHDTKVQMEKMLMLGGGTIATACSLCARYGLKTRYVGRVGDDDKGDFARREMDAEPMDCVIEVVPNASSHFSLIIVDRPTGGRTILWERDPRLLYAEGELNPKALLEGQIMHLDGNDVSASIQAAIWARESGMKIFLDVDKVQDNVGQLLSRVDFAIPSIEFVKKFSGMEDWREGLRIVKEYCPGLVVVTLGEQGSAVLWNGDIHVYKAFPIKTVDSTGAGDVFHGAFIYGMVQGWSLERCMKFSNAAGGLACTRLGARSAIPTVEEVLALERTYHE
jgi:sulfofructose kinase